MLIKYIHTPDIIADMLAKPLYDQSKLAFPSHVAALSITSNKMSMMSDDSRNNVHFITVRRESQVYHFYKILISY